MSFETLVGYYQTTRRYVLEDRILHSLLVENRNLQSEQYVM
jgi:hypothetical protein